jgi:hypothetical protein
MQAPGRLRGALGMLGQARARILAVSFATPTIAFLAPFKTF